MLPVSAGEEMRDGIPDAQLVVLQESGHFAFLEQPELFRDTVWDFLGASRVKPGLRSKLSAEMQQNPDADWQQQKARDIAGPLQKGKHGSWREMLTPQDRQIFQQIAGQTLQVWGYEAAA